METALQKINVFRVLLQPTRKKRAVIVVPWHLPNFPKGRLCVVGSTQRLSNHSRFTPWCSTTTWMDSKLYHMVLGRLLWVFGSTFSHRWYHSTESKRTNGRSRSCHGQKSATRILLWGDISFHKAVTQNGTNLSDQQYNAQAIKVLCVMSRQGV